MTARRWRVAAAVLAVAAAPAVGAHDGPPFPIVEDRMAGRYQVSVWTDPDATDDGTLGGQFWVIVHDGAGAAAPDGTRVQVSVRARTRDVASSAAAARSPNDEAHWFAAVLMDHEGPFDVAVDLAGPLGDTRVDSEVEATYDLRPPPMMLVVYLLPFLAVGGLWLKAVLGRRRYGPPPGGRAGNRPDARPGPPSDT
jgi:hypothetical protein